MKNLCLKWLLLVFWGGILHSLPKQQFTGALTFEKEKIRLIIHDGECQLIGDYYLKNNSSKRRKQIIYYPIIKRENLPFPHYFRVISLLNNKNIDFTIYSKGITFLVDIPPYSVRTYRVEYRQKTPADEMEYILTTTALWGQPLKSADFEIMIPEHFSLDSLSFNTIKKSRKKDKIIYYIHKKDFLPQKNLFIKWRKSHEK